MAAPPPQSFSPSGPSVKTSGGAAGDFRRQDSSYTKSSAGENYTTAAADPRSPGVPRTPGTSARKTPSLTVVQPPQRISEEGSSTNVHVSTTQAGKKTVPEPDSPLNQVVHQSSADLRPKEASASNGGAGTGGGPVQSSPLGRLCCCLQSLATTDAGSGREGRGKPGGNTTEVTRYSRNAPRGEDFAGDRAILPPMAPEDRAKKCLVLDLDETLVHSSFRAVPNPHYIIPVKIEDAVHHVYVCKRPGVDEFLQRAGRCFEVVIYTASLNKYADPLLDLLDEGNVIKHRLFRESCTQYQGNYVKNLSLLGRDLSQTIIVDNSHLSYLFHPDNAIGCTSWIDQKDDVELKVIEDFCEAIMDVDDVRDHCHNWRCGGNYRPTEPS